jgi:coatomer protein complex subunit alpha (xenin)
VIAELQAPRVKYVVWNKDYSMVALISKHQLILANKQLEQLCTISETVRLKVYTYAHMYIHTDYARVNYTCTHRYKKK